MKTLVCAPLLVACATEPEPTPIAPDDPTVLFFGHVRAFDPADPFSRTSSYLVGADVCVGDTCVTTRSDGGYELEVPPSSELMVRYRADGYATADYATATDGGDRRLEFFMASDSVLGNLYAQCGSTFPEADTAAVLIAAYRETATGVEFLDGGAVAASAGRPCYFSGGFLHDDPAQLSTTSKGLGSVELQNVPVGDGSVEVTLTASGQTCQTRRVPLTSGIQTVVELSCR